MIYSLDNKYYVRSLQLSDLDGPYPSWFEDQEICKYNSHGKYSRSINYYRKYIESLDDSSQVVWAICHDDDGHIGNISLQNISIIHRNAEFAIIMGNKKHWCKGIGYKAAVKLFYHGFHKLNLYKIYCATPSNNVGMVSLARKLGMSEEGLRRSHLYLENEWCDIVEFGLLKERFNYDSSMFS